MPLAVCGFLAEVLHVVPVGFHGEVVLRLQLAGHRVFQSAPGRVDRAGTCTWDEEFSALLDATDDVLRLEVLGLERGWLGQRARCLATGSLRLSWIRNRPDRFHPRLRVPMKRSPLPPAQLHLGICVLAPGDSTPPPKWMVSAAGLPWAAATKSPELDPPLKEELPQRSRLEFTMVGLWDIPLSQIQSEDLTVDLRFHAEVHGGIDELVLLEESEVFSVSTKWREVFPAPDGKVCIQLPRTYIMSLELPEVFESVWLVVQVDLQGSEAKEYHAEGRVPLSWCWPLPESEDACPSMNFEDLCWKRFGKIPLSSELQGGGFLKCAFSLTRAEPPSVKVEQPEEDFQSTEEEPPQSEDSESDRAPERTAATAARHTHDFYRKWETLLEDEPKPRKRTQVTKTAMEAEDESDDEDLEDLKAPPCPALAERLEEASGSHFKLYLYIHDMLLLDMPQGEEELQLEMLLGHTVATSFSSKVTRGSLVREFREMKELPIDLPRHSRLELRLRGANVASTVVDLQDRLLSTTGKKDTYESRQLWSRSRCSVGCLQLWVQVRRQQEVLSCPSYWPTGTSWSMELRVILHEVRFSHASAAEVVVGAEVKMPLEQLHRCRIPSPQYSDARTCQHLRTSCEWRFVFSLDMLVVENNSALRYLMIHFFDAKTWQLLGSAETTLDHILLQAADMKMGSIAPKMKQRDVKVKPAEKSDMEGALDLEFCAMPKSIAQKYPVRPGRSAGEVPPDANVDDKVMEQDFCAQQLRSRSSTRSPPRRRKWLRLVAVAAGALLWKELIWHRRLVRNPPRCTRDQAHVA